MAVEKGGTMKRLPILVISIFIITLVSGCIFSSDDNDNKKVKKGAVKGTVTMIVTGEPVANVKVMLINADAKVDTVNPANFTNNRKAFVDSAITGDSGEYTIDNIIPGKYCVAPVNSDTDTTAMYKFTSEQNSESSAFTVNGDSLTVNFIAEKLDISGSSGNYFKYSIYIKKDSRYKINEVHINRMYWSLFIPYYKDWIPCSLNTPEDTANYSHVITKYVEYGFTAVIGTMDNLFELVMNYEPAGGGVDREKKFYFGFTIGHAPEYSEWELDIDAGTIVQK